MSHRRAVAMTVVAVLALSWVWRETASKGAGEVVLFPASSADESGVRISIGLTIADAATAAGAAVAVIETTGRHHGQSR